MQLNSLTEQMKGLQTIPHRALEGVSQAAGKLTSRRLAIQQTSFIFVFPLFGGSIRIRFYHGKGSRKKLEIMESDKLLKSLKGFRFHKVLETHRLHDQERL